MSEAIFIAVSGLVALWDGAYVGVVSGPPGLQEQLV
jgi:hypothetical protein